MKDLSIKTTLTGIGHTVIDLAQCARIGLDTRTKILFGSGEISCLLCPFLVGSPLKSTYNFAILGSAVLGVYGARQKQLWKSMVGGAIVGLTGAGFNILADSILGGSTVGLTSSATRLAAGASGGALVAIATAQATKTNLENKYFFSSLGMGMLGGVLLGVGGNVMDLVNFVPRFTAPILCVCSIIIGKQCAIATDLNLRFMILHPDPRDKITFVELLNKKEYLSLIYNPSQESSSYNELLTLAIENKVPDDWFKMLSNKARGDGLNEDVVLYILFKRNASDINPEDKALYSKYLQYLLVKQVSISINKKLLKLCDQTDEVLCQHIRKPNLKCKEEFSKALLWKKILSEIYSHITEVSPKTYNELLTLAIEHKVPDDWFKMLLDPSSEKLTADQFHELTRFIYNKIIASKSEESAEEYQSEESAEEYQSDESAEEYQSEESAEEYQSEESAEEYQSEDKEIYLKYLQSLRVDPRITESAVFNQLSALFPSNPEVEEGVTPENSTEPDKVNLVGICPDKTSELYD